MKIYHGTREYQKEHNAYIAFSDLFDRAISINDLKEMIRNSSSSIALALDDNTDPRIVAKMSDNLAAYCNELRILTNCFNFSQDVYTKIPFGVWL